MLTREDVQVLTAPFPASAHEFLRGFVYIREDDITARIEAVDPSWELSVNWITTRGDYITVHATMTVCGVKRDGIGMITQEYGKSADKKPIGEPEKVAATDAMKRAARMFGIGRYLLDAPKDMNETTLRKWLNTLSKPPQDNSIPRPAEPAKSELTAPADLTGKLTHITRGIVEKTGKSYYRFNGGVFTFTRQPFRDAGLTVCETWADLPVNETFELPDGVNATVKQVGNDRYEIVSVEVRS